MSLTPPAKPLNKYVRWAILGAIGLATILVISFAGKPAAKDYISYWSAGQLLVHHGDPYSAAQVLASQKAQGYMPARPIMMRNPPWALFLTIPLGFVSARIGLILWMAASVLCVAIYLVQFRVAERDRAWAYVFAPLFACISAGQSAAFLLFGVSTFISEHRRKPLLASLALLFMAIKPHLFFLFLPLIIVDCLHRRRFRLLAGACVALVVATGLAMLFAPHIWSQYFAMLRAEQINTEMLPTPAFLLRYVIAPQQRWLQLVPACFASAWSVWFYARNRREWDWQIHAMPLLFVSVFASPYAWMSDELVLLPAVMLTLTHARKAKYSSSAFMVLNAAAFILLFAQVQLSSPAYAWTSAAWLGWYIYSVGIRALVSPAPHAPAKPAPQASTAS